MPASSSPLINPNQGYSRSGAATVVVVRMTPRATTPAVWVAVTDSPMSAAWRHVPRSPTMYAAMTVLPWPGASAWMEPSRSASPMAARPKATVSRRAATRSVKLRVSRSIPRGSGVVTTRVAGRATGPPVAVASKVTVADRWFGGELSTSFGYCVRRFVTSTSSTSLEWMAAPSPMAMISRQPRRPAKL